MYRLASLEPSNVSVGLIGAVECTHRLLIEAVEYVRWHNGNGWMHQFPN